MRSFVRQASSLRAAQSTLRSEPIVPRCHISKASPSAQPSGAALPSQRLYSFSQPSRSFTSVPSRLARNEPPAETPATDFNELNVLGNTPPPSTSVDVCMDDGFGLNSGLTIRDGNGAILLGGEAFTWRPWELTGDKKLMNKKGQFELPAEALSVFEMLWPRPDLLIIGVGKSNMPLSPPTRQRIAEMGMRVEVLDTRNAAAQFNLLATERGVTDIAAALIPISWVDGHAAK